MKFRVLDIGCGDNPHGDVNCDLNVGYTLQGGDQRRIGIYIDPRQIPNFVQCDAQHLPFRNGAFDKAVSYHVIEHVDDPYAMLKEMSRVAKYEVEISCPHRLGTGAKQPFHKHYFDEQWFVKALKLLGFHHIYTQQRKWDYIHEVFATWLMIKLGIRNRATVGGYYPIYLLLRKIFRDRIAKMLSMHVKMLGMPYEIFVKAVRNHSSDKT